MHFTSNCAGNTYDPTNATTAVGYLLEGGAPPGMSTLQVFGCVNDAAGSQGITLDVPQVSATGTFTDGTISYTEAGGTVWSDMGGAHVVVTTLGAVGGMIGGTFSGALTHPPSQIAQSISGTFSVCHTNDELTP